MADETPTPDAADPDHPASRFFDTQATIAIFLIVSFVAVIVLLIFHTISAETPSGAVLFTAIGTLGTMAVAVVSYYFGSSKGSDSKTAAAQTTLKTLVNKVVTNGEVPPPPHP